jgi:RNA polymerase sigma-70 factor (ECF subfamily)
MKSVTGSSGDAVAGSLAGRTDDALVDAVNDGDAEAFGVLYRRYRDWVVRVAWRYTGNQAEALDVLQDTFAHLLGRFPGFRLTARLTTYLYPVVKHQALALRRKAGRSVSDSAAVESMAAPATQDPGASRAELARVMSGLPEPQREVVLMRFVDGLTLGEIAAVLVDTRTGMVPATSGGEAKREEHVLYGAVDIAQKRIAEQSQNEAVAKLQGEVGQALMELWRSSRLASGER